MENPLGLLSRILPPDGSTEYEAYDLHHKKTRFWGNDYRAVRRAMIPEDVKQRILDSVSRKV